ncbi:MAG: diaminopimelate epimerase [Bacteroidia bacterium]
MQIKFYKYQGTGNDFIIIDNRKEKFPISNTNLVAFLCDRKFGIGADGLMLLQNKKGYDFEMVYYNSDGNPSSMCGNGGRCLVAFAYHLGVIKKKAKFLAVDGEHEAEIITKDGNSLQVKLKMQDVRNIEKIKNDLFLNTGSPHYIKFVKNLSSFNVFEEGKKIRYSNKFKKEGTNVNFLEFKNNCLHVRTYERGVENETLSCGTGVTAAALAYAYLNDRKKIKSLTVETPGGILKIHFNKISKESFNDIWLEGPATLVFEGKIKV